MGDVVHSAALVTWSVILLGRIASSDSVLLLHTE